MCTQHLSAGTGAGKYSAEHRISGSAGSWCLLLAWHHGKSGHLLTAWYRIFPENPAFVTLIAICLQYST